MNHSPDEQKRAVLHRALSPTRALQNMKDVIDIDDIHYSQYKIDHYRKKILENFPRNADLASRFIDALLIYGLGKLRVGTLAYFTLKILEIFNDKEVRDWTREDVDRVVRTMFERKYGNETKRAFLQTIKRLVHFAKKGEIMEKRDGRDYCDEVKHIKPTKFEDREDKIKPYDLLTDQEFLQIIDAIPKVSRHVRRDIAAFYTIKEYAGRPAELLNMKIGGMEFKDGYVTITSHGKTGQKTLTLVVAYTPLLEWMEEHPYYDDPEAYLFYADNKFGRMTYTYLQRLLKIAVRAAGIKKRVWLYLIRHTQLTQVEKEFGSGITNIYGNWGRRSRMRERYVHLANSDQQKAVLKQCGLLKEDEQSALKPRRCSRCNEQNSPDKKRCTRCGFILDAKLAIKAAHRESKTLTSLVKRIEKLEGLDKKMDRIFDELLSKRTLSSQH